MDEGAALVIDNGGGTIKAGVAGEDAPSVRLPTIVGRYVRKPDEATPPIDAGRVYFGEEAFQHRLTHRMRMPIERKIVTDFDSMDKLWHHLFFHELCIAPEEFPVLLTHASDAPRISKEQMIQIMFETYNVPALYLGDQAALALHAAGLTSGTVVDIGATGSLITPIYEGHALAHHARDALVTGLCVTDYLMRILTERGYGFYTTAERRLVNDIKEQLAYCASNFDEEYQKATAQNHSGSGEIDLNQIEGTQLARLPHELLLRINDTVLANTCTRTYRMPDDGVITLDTERFRCVESLFSPCLIGFSAAGLVDCTYNAFMRVPREFRKEVSSQVVLNGGSTLFPGLADRLKRELLNLLPTSAELNVVAPAHRKFGSWLGGSMLASAPDFLSRARSKDLYEELGPSIERLFY